MPKVFTKKIAWPTLVTLIVLFFAFPQLTHAGLIDTGTTFIGGILSSGIEIFILPLSAAILYLSGAIMDASIHFALNTAYIFSLSPAINLGWVIIRDLCNIFFIFIMIYISLGTIIRGSGFNTKHLLTQVIIAAVLINFSLFATKIVVDVSNIFGNWLYGGVQSTLVANSIDQNNPASLSGLIATRLNILGAWTLSGTQANSGTSSSLVDPSQGFIGRMLRLSIVLSATYIFFYAAVLFISRSITILFLLVFSPLGFMGGVLPQIKKYSDEWRSELLSAAIFPIAFLLMLYLSLQFINSLGSLGLSSSMNSVKIFGMDFSVSDYFQYFLIIFLLKATLKIAKDNSGEMGKMLGGMADGLAKMAVGTAVSIGSGGAALGLRAGAAAAFAEKDANGNVNRGKAAWNTFRSGIPLVNRFGTGKSVIKDIKQDLKDGSYDMRNAKIPGIGKGNLASVLSGLTGTKIDGKTSKEYNEQTKAFKDDLKTEKDIDDTLKDIREIELQKNAMANATPQQALRIQTNIDNIKDNVRKRTSKMSVEDLEKATQTLHEREKNDTTLSHFTDQLKPGQADQINNSKLPGNIKKRNHALRTSEFNYALQIQPPGNNGRKSAIASGVQKLSNTEVSKIDISQLNDPDVIDALKVGHLQKIMDEYSYTQRTTIRNAILARGNTQDPAYKWLTSPGGTQF